MQKQVAREHLTKHFTVLVSKNMSIDVSGLRESRGSMASEVDLVR